MTPFEKTPAEKKRLAEMQADMDALGAVNNTSEEKPQRKQGSRKLYINHK